MKSWALAVVALSMSTPVWAQVQPVVRVTTEVDDTSLIVGQTTQARVLAFVENGTLGPNDPNDGIDDDADGDGIFTFDFDVIFSDGAILQVVPGSIVRAQNPVFGDDGAIVPDGINAIGSMFGTDEIGIGSAYLLFTFDVQATAVGSSSVTAGPDADLFGDDLLLYSDDQLDPSQKDYVLGPTITVEPRSTNPGAIPEPITAGLWGLSLLAAGAAFGRRPIR